MKIEFDEKEGKLFEEIIGLYSISKDIMIYAEEVGGESFSPATEEFRHAFDHLMRVFAFKLGFKQADAKYAIENLMPAYRHLYRAAYNLLDYLSIFFRDKVQDEMKSFSGETLQEIFPDYYKEIKPYFVVDDLNKYTEIVERFKSYYGEIIKIKPSLIEYEDEKRKKLVKDEDEKRKNRLLQIIIPSITAIIGAVIGWILTNLLIH
jgi:hypothetical protein